MNSDKWRLGEYREAREGGLVVVQGYAYRGLGFRMVRPRASLQGFPTALWNVTHLGTGHGVAFIRADADMALSIATAVAELGDWTFTGLQGFKNMDPDLPQRLVNLAARVGPALDLDGADGEWCEQAPDLAQECATLQD